MQHLNKIILLNAGSRTREAFALGCASIPLESYRSKEMLLHITSRGEITFWYHGTPVTFDDTYVFTRLRATDVHFCGILNEYFRHMRIPANDPINLSHSQSAEKITQMMLLALAGIRIPETFVFREESFCANEHYVREHLSFPAVYKTDGSKGQNVVFVEDFETLQSLVTKKDPEVLALVQPFIENTFDTRTLVAYGEILGSITRTRTQGHLNNVALGATVKPYALNDRERDIALSATKACRIDFAGVDMIHTDGDPIILEVNKSPQIKGFESAHPGKVFARVASIIVERFFAKQ